MKKILLVLVILVSSFLPITLLTLPGNIQIAKIEQFSSKGTASACVETEKNLGFPSNTLFINSMGCGPTYFYINFLGLLFNSVFFLLLFRLKRLHNQESAFT